MPSEEERDRIRLDLMCARALTASGVFRITAGGVVTHTSLSRSLRTDVPNSLHHSAGFRTAQGWRAWDKSDAALPRDRRSIREAGPLSGVSGDRW